MDVHDALRTRRTIQRFAPGPIPEGALDRALEAATFAPNHKLTWPWRFTIPGPEAREALFRIAYRLKLAKKGPSPDLEARVRATMFDPAHLVVVSQVVDPDPPRAHEDYASCAVAVSNLLLSLHADGVGGMWGTGGITRDAETFAVLGLGANERVVAFVYVGRPAVVPQLPKRPPLEQLVRRTP